jgi:hypothetical protein
VKPPVQEKRLDRLKPSTQQHRTLLEDEFCITSEMDFQGDIYVYRLFVWIDMDIISRDVFRSSVQRSEEG